MLILKRLLSCPMSHDFVTNSPGIHLTVRLYLTLYSLTESTSSLFILQTIYFCPSPLRFSEVPFMPSTLVSFHQWICPRSFGGAQRPSIMSSYQRVTQDPPSPQQDGWNDFTMQDMIGPSGQALNATPTDDSLSAPYNPSRQVWP